MQQSLWTWLRLRSVSAWIYDFRRRVALLDFCLTIRFFCGKSDYYVSYSSYYSFIWVRYLTSSCKSLICFFKRISPPTSFSLWYSFNCFLSCSFSSERYFILLSECIYSNLIDLILSSKGLSLLNIMSCMVSGISESRPVCWLCSRLVSWSWGACCWAWFGKGWMVWVLLCVIA